MITPIQLQSPRVDGNMLLAQNLALRFLPLVEMPDLASSQLPLSTTMSSMLLPLP